ncbi:hypothetical protein EGP98_02915 [bacterium]|nr:hypothetical protein [bacterium]
MYLKEIVVNGFKSFADKIDIVLNDETTCIVGPNGSGKSNIVDAVRWVLGEQSVKTLRGDGTMSDVIFVGSASRKMKNVASVELVFDNNDHYLTIPYTEVSIKRRVFRSGENEYFLNNQKCRLKDILNLFLDSGIGKESFNIIGQGEVQKILSESKDERRLIFEEAASILKYKKRKEEALRKLDRTHEALDRVQDIINELELQVTPLKRQSEEAKKYLEYKKKLESLEIALLAYDIYHLTEEEKLKTTEKKKLDEEIVVALKEENIRDSKILKYKQEEDELQKEITFVQNELLKTAEEVVRQESTLELFKLERRKKEEGTTDEELRILLIEQSKDKKELSLLENEIEELRETLKTKEEEVNTKRRELDSTKMSKKNYLSEYSKIDQDQLSYKHKIDFLVSEEERSSNLPEVVRYLLKNESLKGIYNTIGNVVTIDDIYAKALDIAISASKNFVLVKDDICAKEAISNIKKEKKGRATFFPLNIIKARNIPQDIKNNLEKLDGYCGVLADKIKTEDMYKNVIYNQFGLVLLAKDMDSALNIAKHTMNKYKIITLDGDVINAGGSMSGGTFYKGRSSVMIKQEIESLRRTYQAFIKSRQKVLLDIKETEEKITTIEDTYYKLDKELENIKITITEKDKRYKELKESLMRKNESIKRLEASTTSFDIKEKELIEEFYKKSTYKEKLEKKKIYLDDKLKTLKSNLTSFEDEITYENRILKKKQDVIKNLEIELSRIDVKLNSYLQTLAEEYTITYEKARKEYQLTEEVEESRKLVNQYKMIIKDLGMVNLQAIEEYDRVKTRYEFLLHQKEDLEKAETTLLEIMDELDQLMKDEFLKTFNEIKEKFKVVFSKMFHGGSADLKLTNPEDLLTTGIEIIASPPGKKLSTIQLLSGGEKTLTAISLLFAILNIRKLPFCIFDEVEAALDEANVSQFGKYLEHYKNKTQFLIITHKKKTMEYADTLYGITMQESGVSKLVRVEMENKEEIL